jgi:hypothetical protein
MLIVGTCGEENNMTSFLFSLCQLIIHGGYDYSEQRMLVTHPLLM